MPLIETKGAASAQGFGEFAQQTAPIYIENVFSTWLYTGNSSTQTITNGIDLAGKGGLVWTKSRGAGVDHALYDTARGNNFLSSNTTSGQSAPSLSGMSFSSSGYNLLGADGNLNNTSFNPYVSWTFREQPKFFDIVTYTGNGATTRNISHTLGVQPAAFFVKATSASGDWHCVFSYNGGSNYFMGDTVNGSFALNSTNLAGTGRTASAINISSTTIDVAKIKYDPSPAVYDVNAGNQNGVTYVAYLFAHNAGGFGLSGTDNVISCGSFTTDGSSTATINLGWEPQWVLVKTSNVTGNWTLVDTMRGWVNNGGSLTSESGQVLRANTSGAELGPGSGSAQVGRPFQTGFTWVGNPSDEHIYIAIRRGPMKVPTSGTSVFGLSARTGTGANATVTGSAGVSDAVLIKNRGSAVGDLFASRLTGTGYLETSSTAAEVASGTTILQANPWDVMDGVNVGTTSTITNASANTYINYLFDRAPGFFDVVCWTGSNPGFGNWNIFHNLGVVPELIIYKIRGSGGAWVVGTNFTSTGWRNNLLNTTAASTQPSYANTDYFGAQPTSTRFNVGYPYFSSSGFVAYLFATCAGVSKVGSYTGTGALQTINCGFTGGARFVLIKRTDSTGDWYVYDSARGISSGNDPYLLLNSTAAEVTGTNYVDTTSVGFQVTAAAPAGLNANGGTYIFLAIA